MGSKFSSSEYDEVEALKKTVSQLKNEKATFYVENDQLKQKVRTLEFNSNKLKY